MARAITAITGAKMTSRTDPMIRSSARLRNRPGSLSMAEEAAMPGSGSSAGRGSFVGETGAQSGEAGRWSSSQLFVDEEASTGAMACNYHTSGKGDSGEKRGGVSTKKRLGDARFR